MTRCSKCGLLEDRWRRTSAAAMAARAALIEIADTDADAEELRRIAARALGRAEEGDEG